MGFLTRVIGRRMKRSLDESIQTPDAQAALEQSQRMMNVAETARTVAGSGLDDQSACAELKGRLPDDPAAAGEAIKHLGALRESYLDDRGYRLLTAAVDNTSVRPIDPAVRDQFLAEARLGRMSLKDAFNYLARLQPRLRELETRRRETPRPKQGRSTSFSRSEPDLVGPWAESPHAVLNTELARNVVSNYLAAKASGRDSLEDPTPVFERKKRVFTGSFALFGKGDTRPRARN